MTKQALSVSFKSLKFKRSKFSNPSITKRQLGQGHGLLYGGPEDCILDPRAINRVVYIQPTRDQIQFSSNSSTRIVCVGKVI